MSSLEKNRRINTTTYCRGNQINLVVEKIIVPYHKIHGDGTGPEKTESFILNAADGK